jgi:hypothetical protein
MPVTKDLMFKLRLDAQDRERLDAVAAHFSAPAATAVRMLIKQKYDEIKARHGFTDAESFDMAMLGYARHCDREGLTYSQPSATASDWDGDEYVLRNVNGELARFTSKDGKFRMKKGGAS